MSEQSGQPTQTTEPMPPPPPTRPARRLGATALLATLAVGAAGGGGIVHLLGHRHADEHADHGMAATKAPEKKQLYQCPMHPTIVQDHPGDCPICGMKLVPMDDASAAGEKPAADAEKVEGLAAVTIEPRRQQLIGLRTAEAARGTVGGSWRTNGRVAVDETRVRHVNVKVGGFVERIYVDFTGKPVARGQALFSIYSPEVVSAQNEYLLAKRTQDALAKGGMLSGSGEDLVASARMRLKHWDIPDSAIEDLARTGEPRRTISLVSPISGVVTKKDVVEGARIEEGAMPYEITDLSSVWVLADVYESELPKVRIGMPAVLTLQAFPNRTFKGKVVFIDPLLDKETRTAKVRLAFPNPKGELKPEMFGEVVLKSGQRQGLRVPVDAIVRSGTKDVVFVALGDGKFQPREVQVGETDGEAVEIVRGLDAGEKVVTRANFLVDSESRLKASLAAMGGK